jgi:hypothetical protein
MGTHAYAKIATLINMMTKKIILRLKKMKIVFAQIANTTRVHVVATMTNPQNGFFLIVF